MSSAKIHYANAEYTVTFTPGEGDTFWVGVNGPYVFTQQVDRYDLENLYAALADVLGNPTANHIIDDWRSNA